MLWQSIEWWRIYKFKNWQFDKFVLFSGKESEASGSSNLSAVTSKKSELFDHIVYLSEVCDVMAIAMAELPNLLSPPDVAEALLRLKFGPQIICHMVANQPDSFNEGEWNYCHVYRKNLMRLFFQPRSMFFVCF